MKEYQNEHLNLSEDGHFVVFISVVLFNCIFFYGIGIVHRQPLSLRPVYSLALCILIFL